MRLFVGVPLATAVAAELSVLVTGLRSVSDCLRWTEPDSWHITLQFLGNTDQEHCECLVAHLSEVRCAPVCICLGDLSFFDRAGVFFADVACTPDLLALAERITAATSRCGFIAETRPFHPHITLARAKGGAQTLRALRTAIQRKPTFTPFVTTEFLLYESCLLPVGANYEVLTRFPLIATQ